ncbi:unnamed protein product [Blepharisma stoltei]|uniref:Ribosomal protein S13 n=1 Tax=Blepharisma stoltei TaxID=1481888 RepID=A0AAU9J3A6_9CILI|nr:unnamed protein product [Blepharisma stoltei]
MQNDVRIIQLYGRNKTPVEGLSPRRKRSYKITANAKLCKTSKPVTPITSRSPIYPTSDENRYLSPSLFRCGELLIPIISSPQVQKSNAQIVKKLQSFKKIGYQTSKNIRKDARNDISIASFRVKHSTSRIKQLLDAKTLISQNEILSTASNY